MRRGERNIKNWEPLCWIYFSCSACPRFLSSPCFARGLLKGSRRTLFLEFCSGFCPKSLFLSWTFFFEKNKKHIEFFLLPKCPTGPSSEEGSTPPTLYSTLYHSVQSLLEEAWGWSSYFRIWIFDGLTIMNCAQSHRSIKRKLYAIIWIIKCISYFSKRALSVDYFYQLANEATLNADSMAN